MQILFSPAIVLMNRLNYSQKFIVLGCLSILPLLFVTLILYQNLNRDTLESQRGLERLRQIEVVSKAIQLLQEHRGLSTAVLGGFNTFHDKQVSKAQAARLALHTVEQRVSFNPTAQAAFKAAQSTWADIQQNSANLNVDTSYVKHTQLISQLLAAENSLGDDTLLHLDRDIYHLIVLLTKELPVVLEHIGQLQAYGIGHLTTKSITEDEKLSLLLLKASIDQSLHSINALIDATHQSNPDLASVLEVTRESIDNTAQFITTHVIPDITQGTFTTTPDYYYTAVTLALDTVYKEIYDSFLPATKQLIETRIVKAKKTLYLGIRIPFGVYTLILYFMIGAHLGMKNRMTRLSRAVKAFAGGDFKRRIP